MSAPSDVKIGYFDEADCCIRQLVSILLMQLGNFFFVAGCISPALFTPPRAHLQQPCPFQLLCPSHLATGQHRPKPIPPGLPPWVRQTHASLSMTAQHMILTDHPMLLKDQRSPMEDHPMLCCPLATEMNHLRVLHSIMLPQGNGEPCRMQTIGLPHTLTLESGHPCTPVPAQQNCHTHKLAAMLHLCGGPFPEALIMGLLQAVAPTGHLHMQLPSLQSSSTCTPPYMQAQGCLAPVGQLQTALL